MIKFSFTFLAILCMALSVQAQRFQNYASKIQSHISTGFSTSFSSMHIGSPTDNLIQYDQVSPAGRLISLSFFPGKRWGVNVNMEPIGRTSNNPAKMVLFENHINRIYSGRYFTSTNYSLDKHNNSENMAIGAFGRGTVGLVYRLEKNRLFCYPQVSLGFNKFELNDTKVRLKEYNTNHIDMLHFNGKVKTSSLISYHLSAKTGFKLNKILWTHTDIILTYYKPSFTITEMRYNEIYDVQESHLVHEYNKAQPSFNFQIGLTMAFGQAKK